MTRPGGAAIVGRTEPRERLEQMVVASAMGRTSTVLVSGDAGMGKTSLIRAALENTADGSTVVAWGTCWQGDGAPGFWPWMQALDDIAHSIGRDAAIVAAGDDRDRLAALIRELGPAPETPDDPDRRRFLLLDAAVRWLEIVTASQHVAIVLDDLQWADSSTLDLLEYVVARPVAARLMIVGAVRHDELDTERSRRLASVGSQIDRIHLEGLAVEDVEELAATICGPALAHTLARDLHNRTGGHPLFVRELARLSGEGAPGSLPTAVTGALTRRLETLPADSRSVLDAASVLGNRLLPDVLGEVADESVAEVVHLLDAAEEAGVIRTGPADELWFTHDLFRETLYGQLSLTERARLHGRVGEALEARNRRGARVPPGDLARHFVLAVTADPGKAIHWAREAARDERRRAAFGESAAHLRRARLAAVDVGWTIPQDLLVRILIEEADAEARSGEPGVARGLLAEAATAATRPEEEVDVALAVQRLGAKFATPRGEIVAQLESALRSITGHDIARQARVTAALARELQHSVSQDRRRAGPLSEEALTLARQSDDDETLVSCLLARHDALWGPGTGTVRSALGREIADVGSRLGDTDRLAEGLLLEANGLLEAGSPGFRPVLDRWFGLLDARNEPRDRYLVQTRRAALALLEGDAERAETLMYDAAALGEKIHEPDTGNVLMSQRVALARVRNDPDELAVLAADAVRWWTGAPVLAHAVAAGAHAAAGDLEPAAREVAMLSASSGWRGEDSYLRSVLVADLAVAVTALHDAEMCSLLLDDIAPLTDSCGVNGALVAFAGPFAHAAGILAAELEDFDLAETMLERSIDTSRRLGAVVWVKQGETARRALASSQSPAARASSEPAPVMASLSRSQKIWTLTYGDEQGSLPHVKGLADIAILVRHQGQEVPALELMGHSGASGTSDELIDLEALKAYRDRLDELEAEIDEATSDADFASIDRLAAERDQLLAEIRRTTGLGGRIRTIANEPAERARKAVSGRIRDAIRRLDNITPRLAAHLDRSIVTGLRCAYVPTGAEADIRWRLDI